MGTEDPFDTLHISLISYFNSSKYSDLVIRCEGQEYRVHKIVLCGQSKYFSNVCDGDWKEAADGVIELKEDDVYVVEAMLHFMYRFDYDGSGNDQRPVSPMLFNVKVYSIADKYGILALKSQAEEKFYKAVKPCWDMDDFAHVITEIYSSTPSTDRGLRDIVVNVAHEHIKALLKKSDFLCVLEETVGFGADVVRLMDRGMKSTLSKYQCPKCGDLWEAVLSSRDKHYCVQCGHSRSNWDNYVVK